MARNVWKSFVNHEGLAWAATAAWLAIVGSAIWLKGADYSPSARLDLSGWANVAQIVSAVVAPVAVLWVVRSFYVQKKELAEAVAAASRQAGALLEQNSLLKDERDAHLHPRMTLHLIRSSNPMTVTMGGSTTRWVYEHFNFRIKNIGTGGAHELSVIAIGETESNQLWRYTAAGQISIFNPDDEKSPYFRREIVPDAPRTTELFALASYRNRAQQQQVQYFKFFSIRDQAEGEESTEDEYLKWLADRPYDAEGTLTDA